MKEEQQQSNNQEVTIDIITSSKNMPEMECRNFFHSIELFQIVEKTPGQRPYMVIARQDGRIKAHLLAMLRRRGSLLPPYLFSQGRVYGEGEYEEGADKQLLFSKMLHAITQKLNRKLCFYIEFSDLSAKMFGYKLFRQQGYIPVQWMEVHNSLHSMPPEDRISEKVAARIRHAIDYGMEVKSVETEEEFADFYRMLRRHLSTKPRRYLPSQKMFSLLKDSDHCSLFITKYKGKAIGACTCMYTNRNAYLWYMAAKTKSHPMLHPATATVWGAITHAYEHQYWHIYFLDVGLPFKKNAHRDFILSFGGKEVGTYRWFRFSLPWLNRIVGYLYRE